MWVLAICCGCWMIDDGARANDTCADSLRILGPDDAARGLREAIGRGALARTPAARCAGTVVTIARAGDGWRVSAHEGRESVDRRVESLEAAAVWVESWLAPPDSLQLRGRPEGGPPATPDGSEAANSGPSETPPAGAPEPSASDGVDPAATEQPATGSVAEEVAGAAAMVLHRTAIDLLGHAGTDDELGVWAGAELGVRIPLLGSLGAGAAAAIAWSPDLQSAGSRRQIRGSVRALWLAPLGIHDARGIAGLGWTSGAAWRVIRDEEEDYDRGSLFFEVGADASLSSGSFSVVAGVLGRVHVGSESPPEVDAEDAVNAWAAAPPPLAIDVRLGLAYTFGGGSP